MSDEKFTNAVETSLSRAMKFYEADPSHPDLLAAQETIRKRDDYRDFLLHHGIKEDSPEEHRALKRLAIFYLAGRLSSQPIN